MSKISREKRKNIIGYTVTLLVIAALALLMLLLPRWRRARMQAELDATPHEPGACKLIGCDVTPADEFREAYVDYYYDSQYIPESLQAKRAGEVAAIVYYTTGSDEMGGAYKSSSGGSVDASRERIEVRIVRRSDGETLAEKTFRASMPSSAKVGAGQGVYGSVEDADVTAWVRGVYDERWFVE